MAQIPKVVDRNATKAAYILVAEDPTVKGGVQYYVSKDLNETNSTVEIRGQLLTKTNAEKLTKEPNAEITGNMVNKKLPWHRVIRIDNLNYRVK